MGPSEGMSEVLTEDVEEIPEEQMLLNRFRQETRVPGWAQKFYDQFGADARYMNKETPGEGSEDPDAIVETNWLYRYQQAKLGKINPSQPQLAIKPGRLIGADPLMIQTAATFAETMECVAQRLFELGDGEEAFQEAVQDADTCGISWVRCTWIEDRSRDPLGHPAVGSLNDNIDRLRRLEMELAAGHFDEESEEFGELVRVADYVAEQAALMQMGLMEGDPRNGAMQALAADPKMAAVSGQAELPTFRGVQIDTLRPEDVFFDMNSVRDIRRYYLSGQFTYRYWYTPEEIADRYAMTAEEAKTLREMHNNKEEGDQSDTNPEEEGASDAQTFKKAGLIAVWEREDRATHRRYIWCDGLDRFLVDEVMELAWPKFFSVVPVYHNTVSRRLFPLSSVQLGKLLQEEINSTRSDRRDAVNKSQPRVFIDKSLVEDEEEFTTVLENSRPLQAIVVNSLEDLKKGIYPMSMGQINEQLYDDSRAHRDLQAAIGAPQQATGVTGAAEFAAEVKEASANMEQQAGVAEQNIEKAITAIFSMIIHYASQAFDPEYARIIAGPGAIWPTVGIQQLVYGMSINVSASASEKPDMQKVIAAFQALPQFIQAANSMSNNPVAIDAVKLTERMFDEAGLGKADDVVTPLNPAEHMPAQLPVGTLPGQPGAMNVYQPPGMQSAPPLGAAGPQNQDMSQQGEPPLAAAEPTNPNPGG
jgi:hypothetical protein